MVRILRPNVCSVLHTADAKEFQPPSVIPVKSIGEIGLIMDVDDLNAEVDTCHVLNRALRRVGDNPRAGNHGQSRAARGRGVCLEILPNIGEWTSAIHRGEEREGALLGADRTVEAGIGGDVVLGDGDRRDGVWPRDAAWGSP
jgi:hypothetical protein